MFTLSPLVAPRLHMQVLCVVKGHRLRAEREPHFLARLKEEHGQVPEWSLQVE